MRNPLLLSCTNRPDLSGPPKELDAPELSAFRELDGVNLRACQPVRSKADGGES